MLHDDIPQEVRVAIPTRDGMGVLHTALLVAGLGDELGVPGGLRWVESPGNISRGRNELSKGWRQALGRDRAWILWVDSDLYLADVGPVKDAIVRSWETGVGFTAHYAMADGRSHIMRARSYDWRAATNYTAEEIDALPGGHPVEQAGLGFSFLPTDLTYRFHSDEFGEDVHFYHDTQAVVRLEKEIRLRHRKTVWL